MTDYPSTLPLRDALKIYFDANGFGVDGGYSSAWVEFKLGPIPFPFPNTAGRKRAVRIHDLHHIATGYRTDFTGEMEIGAFEVGSGCRGYIAAWVLNLSALGGGAVMCPRRAFSAFVRGRRARTLYDEIYGDALLSRTVGEARALLRLDAFETSPKPGDYIRFGVAAAIGIVVGHLLFAAFLPLAIVMWPLLTFARSKSTRSPERDPHALVTQ